MRRKVALIIFILIVGAASAWLVYGQKETDSPQAKVIQRIEQATDQIRQESFQGQQNVLLDVPFSPQAPFGQWEDPRQQDGCEEASVIMAVRWVRGQSLTRQEALDEIFSLAQFEEKQFGTYHDTSAEDTAKLVSEYYGYDNVSIKRDIGIQDIKQALSDGNLVLVPADGIKLKNPNYKQPGPPRHMLVVKGYDESRRQFITNDPGTRKGEGYRYDYDVLINAVLDYATGHMVPIQSNRTVMIVIGK